MTDIRVLFYGWTVRNTNVTTYDFYSKIKISNFLSRLTTREIHIHSYTTEGTHI